MGLDSETRQMVIETVRQLKNRLLPKEKISEFDKLEVFPEEVIRTMLGPDIGLQLLFIPVEYGGMGGGALDCCAVTREMSKICLGVATAFFAIQLGSDPLRAGGTEDQKKKWLGAIAKGNSLVAYAVTEPEAGSNLASLKTKADPVYREPNKIVGYRINGTKQFISTGGYADFITLLAKTPEGPTFFIVEKGTPGFIQGKGEEKHGIRASNTSPLTFNDVFVPIENMIGEVPGMGLKQANDVFGFTRLMVGAMALGAGEAAMEIVIPYAKERIQFGSPLSEKQGYTHKLVVPHMVRLEAAAAYLEEVATWLDSGQKDLEVEGSIAKIFATETANRLADDAIQALGGYGYIREYQVEKIKRDVKITCIYEGTSEIQQNIISTFRWKKDRKTKGAFYEGMASEMKAIDSVFPDAGCRFYSLSAKALKETLELAHEHRLTRQQYLMFALADMMIHVEVGISLAKKAYSLKDERIKSRKLKSMSRIFAWETSRLVAEKALLVTLGSGLFNSKTISQFMQTISYTELLASHHNIINDMNLVSDILFERGDYGKC
jgi:alkylation response protein AidB-like acyl-CoA dehydrogenase